MHSRHWQALLVALPLTAASLIAGPGANAAPRLTQASLAGLGNRRVCGAAAAPKASCSAHVVVDASGNPLASITYGAGFAPSDLASAYRNPLPAAGAPWAWNGQTVGIVDAYRNPNAVSDVAAYRAQFGLPACTVASGCFTEVNESGNASPLPAGDTGWGQEIDLDIQMVSATCPMCKILLVDGTSTSLTDLGSSVNTAAQLGATAISNSYGTSGEFSSEGSYGDSYYNNHPGIAITASSGDNGYGVEFPAVSRNVTAVGGTSLSRSSNARGWSETVWSGAGSGCSAYIAKPTPQVGVVPAACSRRAVADVAAVANPSTGVAVYDSYGSVGGANWLVFGGTSVASPIIASFYAQANAAGAGSFTYNEKPYANRGSLNDVTSGSNGNCTSRRNTATAFLCTGEVGYDGPTGLGTPSGLGAF